MIASPPTHRPRLPAIILAAGALLLSFRVNKGIPERSRLSNSTVAVLADTKIAGSSSLVSSWLGGMRDLTFGHGQGS